ncbi:NAD kinase [Dysgonomonas sp. 520]|uniref:NAD kinase n=1 Tax=Dysgonomonas sp. 520 TaxID=2302931 RepID=UPI0013D47C41|nr:NAD kinase [Dysgonomonas sp. 520]NDW10026.1 NAD kinase [Dysgonomonas sp. 520]
MKIAIFGSNYQRKEQIEQIFGILSDYDARVCIEREFHDYLISEFGMEFPHVRSFSGEDFNADCVFSIGGDGTFLKTVAAIGKKDIPILGINSGRLGFLADITEDNLNETLHEILQGKYRIEHRTQLELMGMQDLFQGKNFALNEIAVLKQDTASMININAYINDEYLTSYQCDGLIVSTPTGSTAYSLSVGGPIMNPNAANFIISAIAPHSLNTRPLVIEDNSIIVLEVESRNRNFLISLDGRSEVIPTGLNLTIKKSVSTIKLAKRIGHTFYGTLRDKLMWGVDPRTK